MQLFAQKGLFAHSFVSHAWKSLGSPQHLIIGMGYGHSTLVEKAISTSNFPFIHFNTEDQKHFKLFLSHFCFLPFATHVNLCTNLHIHTYYHDYFLYFLLRCKPKKFLALILKLKQSQSPPGTMTLHYLPFLCRIRTENSLAVGKAGERIPNKLSQKTQQNATNKKAKASNSEQNIVLQ